MVAKVQIKRTSTANSPPTGLDPGELAVEMVTVPPRLWVGVPVAQDANLRKLLSPAGIFIGDAPPLTPVAGQVWWKSDLGKTFTWYADADSGQWVEI